MALLLYIIVILILSAMTIGALSAEESSQKGSGSGMIIGTTIITFVISVIAVIVQLIHIANA